MGVLSLRQRRSVAQLYAVSGVEREIRAADLHPRRKYLRDFTEAFQSYRGPLSSAELLHELLGADILLVGDYHALPASQLYAATLFEQLASARRPLVLALEAVFARDQRLLDDWQIGKVDERGLRECLRFDRQWGFSWDPFFRLLCSARSAGARIYGVDTAPRGNLRQIAARDEHAAERIAAISGEVPDARIVVLFGESHMAPQHLPALIHGKLPESRTLTLLQNIDPLYWQAEGESRRRIEAVRVSDDVLCVFNATPLEKYESYRQCLQRWRQERPSALDLKPAFYNLISALLRFLGIDREGNVPERLSGLLPQVKVRASAEQFRPSLQRMFGSRRQVREFMQQIERESCVYVAENNCIYATAFELPGAAAASATFVHALCSGGLTSPATPATISGASEISEDRFYALCLRAAITEFGARTLHSGRRPVTEQELFSRYSREPGELESEGLYTYRDHLRMIDFIVLHQDFECHAHRYRQVPELIGEGRAYCGDKLRFVTGMLGQMLGTQLYQSYLDGRVNRRYLRSLYFRRLQRPGEAKLGYFQLARRTRQTRKRLLN